MATAWSELAPFIRHALGDTGTRVQLVSDSVVQTGIRMALMTIPEGATYTADGSGNVSPDLTDRLDKAIVILSAALSIARPTPRSVATRMPVFSVSKQGLDQIAANIEQELYELRENADTTGAMITEQVLYQNSSDLESDTLDRSPE